jgi:hypothetical protein
VVGVGGVDARASRAAGGAAVAAGEQQAAGGLVGGAEGVEHFAGGGVVGGGLADQGDRPGTAAEPFDLGAGAVEVGMGGQVQQVPHGRADDAVGIGGGVHAE